MTFLFCSVRFDYYLRCDNRNSTYSHSHSQSHISIKYNGVFIEKTTYGTVIRKWRTGFCVWHLTGKLCLTFDVAYLNNYINRNSSNSIHRSIHVIHSILPTFWARENFCLCDHPFFLFSCFKNKMHLTQKLQFKNSDKLKSHNKKGSLGIFLNTGNTQSFQFFKCHFKSLFGIRYCAATHHSLHLVGKF